MWIIPSAKVPMVRLWGEKREGHRSFSAKLTNYL